MIPWWDLKKASRLSLEIFAARGVPVSFFVAMGPDHSGRAIRRLFTHKGFLQKMLRTGAPRLYGLKTMLYGTLLPGPAIAASSPDLLRNIIAAGHELGIHGYDHVLWQDRLDGMSHTAVAAEISPGPEGVFRKSWVIRPSPLPPPAGSALPPALDALVAEHFYYLSNTRGYAPYFPKTPDRAWPILEIPTTLPTMDELLGLHGRSPTEVNEEILAGLRDDGTQILTIHAEVEGRVCRREFI